MRPQERGLRSPINHRPSQLKSTGIVDGIRLSGMTMHCIGLFRTIIGPMMRTSVIDGILRMRSQRTVLNTTSCLQLAMQGRNTCHMTVAAEKATGADGDTSLPSLLDLASVASVIQVAVQR